METHIHRLGALGLSFAFANGIRSRIVSSERCDWLFVTTFVKDDGVVDGFMWIDVQGSEFNRMEPLLGGIFAELERKKCPPARFCA